MKRMILVYLLAISIGTNILLPPEISQPDPEELLEPLNGEWDEEKN